MDELTEAVENETRSETEILVDKYDADVSSMEVATAYKNPTISTEIG